jgi:hypothetical protein
VCARGLALISHPSCQPAGRPILHLNAFCYPERRSSNPFSDVHRLTSSSSMSGGRATVIVCRVSSGAEDASRRQPTTRRCHTNPTKKEILLEAEASPSRRGRFGKATTDRPTADQPAEKGHATRTAAADSHSPWRMPVDFCLPLEG